MKGNKPKAVEELIDYYFHRRLAWPVVKIAQRLGLTPNQVTWLSLLVGCLSAYCFYKNLFPLGGIGLLVAIVLDCSDGMLARVTGVSSPTGRILDGLFDAIWISLAWLGIYQSGQISLPAKALFPFIAMSGISMPLHCWTYDGVKSTYLALCEPHFSEKNLSWRDARRQAKESFSKRHYFESLLYYFMFLHHSIFVRSDQPSISLTESDRDRIQTFLSGPMRLWSFLGEGTHLTLIYVAALLTPFYDQAMLAALIIILIPLNLLWAIAAIFWFQAKHQALSRSYKEIANPS